MAVSPYPQLELRRNSEQLLLKGHPWVYSGAVAGCDPAAEPGAIVDAVEMTLDGSLRRESSLRSSS